MIGILILTLRMCAEDHKLASARERREGKKLKHVP